MKIRCKKCKEFFNDKDIVLIQKSDGGSFGGSAINKIFLFCNKCYEEDKELLKDE